MASNNADFFRVADGEEYWIRCETGRLMILPPNSLHAFYNKTSEPCHLLGISTPVPSSILRCRSKRRQKQTVRVPSVSRGDSGNSADRSTIQFLLRTGRRN